MPVGLANRTGRRGWGPDPRRIPSLPLREHGIRSVPEQSRTWTVTPQVPPSALVPGHELRDAAAARSCVALADCEAQSRQQVQQGDLGPCLMVPLGPASVTRTSDGDGGSAATAGAPECAVPLSRPGTPGRYGGLARREVGR